MVLLRKKNLFLKFSFISFPILLFAPMFFQRKKTSKLRVIVSGGEIVIGEYEGQSGIFFLENKKGHPVVRSKIFFGGNGDVSGFDFSGKLIAKAGSDEAQVLLKDKDANVSISAGKKSLNILLKKGVSKKKEKTLSLKVSDSSVGILLSNPFNEVNVGADEENGSFFYGKSKNFNFGIQANGKGGKIVLKGSGGKILSTYVEKKGMGLVMKEKDKLKFFVGGKGGRLKMIIPSLEERRK